MNEGQGLFQPFKPRVVPRAAIRASAESIPASGSTLPDRDTIARIVEVHAQAVSLEDATPDSNCTAEAAYSPAVADGDHSEAQGCDSQRCVATLRDRAIALAAEACALALHEAVARNPLFVRRFVDDALRAAGTVQAKAVRLHPASAAICGGVEREIIADSALQCGEVVVETDSGSVRAVIEDRAALLARAATHA